MPDDPRAKRRSAQTDDSLARPDAKRPPVRRSPVGESLENFLQAAYAAGPQSEADSQAALAELRKNGEDAIIAIARREAGCRRSDYPLRWALVYGAGQLRHDAAFSFLKDVVLTPIPPEASSDPHSFSTVAEETVIRTTAVEAIGKLAENGNKLALEGLFEFLSLPSLSVRRASVQALLATDKELRGRISDYLSRDQRHLLDIEPAKVTDVAQIDDPEADLRQRPRSSKAKPSPPGLSEDRPPTSPRSPRLKRGG